MKELFLDNLPDEILQRILLFSSTASLSKFAQLSTKWKRLTEDESFWKEKIQTELTTNPILLNSQTYKEYYRDIYQGIYQGAHYTSKGLNSYLAKVQKSESPATFNQHLHFACSIGAEIWIAELLQKGALLKCIHLKDALENGNMKAIELLLKNIDSSELNFQWQDFSGTYQQPFYSRNMTVFHEAVELKNSAVNLKRLFEERHKINVLPKLHIAAASGDTIQLIQLLEQGSSIDEKDIAHCTALWWAIVCGQEECANILISQNADLANIAVGEYKSALMVAIRHRQTGCLKLIIEQPINLKEETKEDIFHPIPLTVLHEAAEYNFSDGLELLFKKGVKLNNSKYPFSPLHIAAKHGHADCMTLLLQQGAKVNQKGKWIDNDEDYKDDTVTVSTPLGLAAAHGHVTCIKLLLAAGADPTIEQEQQDIHKKSLITTNKYSVLRQLIRHLRSSRLYSHDSHGLGAELSKSQVDLNLHHFPFSKDYLDGLELLLKAGANPNKGNSDNLTALLNLIIDSYAYGTYTNSKLNIYDQLVEKCTELLITFKVNVDAADNYGQTALHYAVQAGKIKLVQLLIEQGLAAISLPDNQGNTPLIVAAQGGHAEIVKYLLEKGASLEESNKKGETALTCAEMRKHSAIIEMLKINENSSTNMNVVKYKY